MRPSAARRVLSFKRHCRRLALCVAQLPGPVYAPTDAKARRDEESDVNAKPAIRNKTWRREVRALGDHETVAKAGEWII
jgi:hypothetical protein